MKKMDRAIKQYEVHRIVAVDRIPALGRIVVEILIKRKLNVYMEVYKLIVTIHSATPSLPSECYIPCESISTSS